VLEAGVDEAGRGPLAGPVVAAAVILDPQNPIAGLRDSKKLSARTRSVLKAAICERAVAVGIGFASPEEIDEINIYWASLLAMRRAVDDLTVQPTRVLCDGKAVPELSMLAEAIVGGDDTVPSISAASIVAKVTRDDEMMVLHRRYPDFAFDKHKGYPTKAHIAALSRYGVTAVHRRSFAPVKRRLAQDSEH
jgi:ribonuclease HII